MRLYLGADPEKIREENKIRGEVHMAPLVNSPQSFGHDIVHGSTVVVYTDPDNKDGTRLTLGTDYLLSFQDAIATDQSQGQCFRQIIFLRTFTWALIDYHAYGDLVGREFISDVSANLAEHDSRLGALELFSGANLYTAERWAKSLNPEVPPHVEPNADNPGVDWLTSRPVVGLGEYLWSVVALWRGSVRLAPWAPPVLVSGVPGPIGLTGLTGPSPYITQIDSTAGDEWTPGSVLETTLIARVFDALGEVTSTIDSSRFKWLRVSKIQPSNDDLWNSAHAAGYKQVTVTVSSLNDLADYYCEIFSAS